MPKPIARTEPPFADTGKSRAAGLVAPAALAVEGEGVSIPTNFDWPTELRQFKQDDTARFVVGVMQPASTCADCEQPMAADEAKSLTVDVTTNEPVPAGSFPVRRFESYVTHSRCKSSELTVRRDPSLVPLAETDVTWIYAKLIISGQELPFVVYRLASNNQLIIERGERVDVQANHLLSAGFTMNPSPDMGDLVETTIGAGPAEHAFGRWDESGLLQLIVTVNGIDDVLVSIDVDDDTFRDAVNGMGGLLWITGTGVEVDTHTATWALEAAAARGTLIAGLTRMQ